MKSGLGPGCVKTPLLCYDSLVILREKPMRRFVEQADRGQWTLLPECLDDFIDESNPVGVIDVFVDALDLTEMSFEGVEPAATRESSDKAQPQAIHRMDVTRSAHRSNRIRHERMGFTGATPWCRMAT